MQFQSKTTPGCRCEGRSPEAISEPDSEDIWQFQKEIAQFIPSDKTEIASDASQSDCVTIKCFTQKME